MHRQPCCICVLWDDGLCPHQAGQRGARGAHKGLLTTSRLLLQVAIKFFAQQARYQHERLFYETRAALDAEARLTAVPDMLAAFAGQPATVHTATQMPASLVLEAGDFTLQASPGQ